MKIGLIDLGYGNIKSVYNALLILGYNNLKIIDSQSYIDKVDKLIIPGNGSSKCCFSDLKRIDILEKLKLVLYKIPILGICLGKQLFFNKNSEAKNGLGIINAKVKKFKLKKKVPHIGWNKIKIEKNHKVLSGIRNKDLFFFSHSFYIKVLKNTILSTKYINKFSALFSIKNLLLSQFHPEISSFCGLRLIKNFLTCF
ncbi:imidazole glycerol phosphate synthase subunit HisH [Candidatus Vidania fulgoroideorum]